MFGCDISYAIEPTISFLHEPGERRYSLALDIAEILKPILADRLLFSMFNRKQLRESDFDQNLNRCLLNAFFHEKSGTGMGGKDKRDDQA